MAFSVQVRPCEFVTCPACSATGKVIGTSRLWTSLTIGGKVPCGTCRGLAVVLRRPPKYGQPTYSRDGMHFHTCPFCKKEWACDAMGHTVPRSDPTPCPNCEPYRSPCRVHPNQEPSIWD